MTFVVPREGNGGKAQRPDAVVDFFERDRFPRKCRGDKERRQCRSAKEHNAQREMEMLEFAKGFAPARVGARPAARFNCPPARQPMTA